jgi:RNA polymerase sigma factor (sigma-70 family)
MNAVTPTAPPGANSELLTQTRAYLLHRKRGLAPSYHLEIAWRGFYEVYSEKIRAYAFKCGAGVEEVVDCIQEVWRELLVRLPTFHLDLSRGQFDTWLYQIVRSKAADLLRSHKHRFFQGNSDTLQAVTDNRPSPEQALEHEEQATIAWDELRRRLSECNFRVLTMRLVEQRPVAEVAEKLGLSNQQVWYRYHRARRELEEIGSALARDQRSPHPNDPPREKTKKNQESAQGKRASSVSRSVRPSSLADQGGNCVDYVFQNLELGRRELNPEWKVEWNCDAEPTPILYIRKTAIVAYAELCGHGDFINGHWPRIVNAAIAAGVAAGIATIIATPTAALPIFQTEFHKQLQGKGVIVAEDKIQVALSAMQEANGPWCLCKD